VSVDAQPTISSLREEIEAVDERLIAAIAERVALARSVGRAKVAAGQPVTDPAREAAVVMRASARARMAGLPEDDIRALYWKLMAISRKVQLADLS
jgi:chorismate mutase